MRANSRKDTVIIKFQTFDEDGFLNYSDLNSFEVKARVTDIQKRSFNGEEFITFEKEIDIGKTHIDIKSKPVVVINGEEYFVQKINVIKNYLTGSLVKVVLFV